MLQSKVNDVIMDVVLQRLEKLLIPHKCVLYSYLEDVIKMVAKSMALDIRLEDHHVHRHTHLIEDGLYARPFLFVGYRFHVASTLLQFHEGRAYTERPGGMVPRVTVQADYPRFMSQLPYPTMKWIKRPEDVIVAEAARLGSIVLSFGYPQNEQIGAYTEFRDKALALLERAISRGGKLEMDWLMDNPLAPLESKTLAGLMRAVSRHPGELWLEPRIHSRVAPTVYGQDWADIVEQEELEEMERVGLQAVQSAIVPRPEPFRPAAIPTHPVTRKNDGRPPPTAVWAPDKLPRPDHNTTRAVPLNLRNRRELKRDQFMEQLISQEVKQAAEEAFEESDRELEETEAERRAAEYDRFHRYERDEDVYAAAQEEEDRRRAEQEAREVEDMWNEV